LYFSQDGQAHEGNKKRWTLNERKCNGVGVKKGENHLRFCI